MRAVSTLVLAAAALAGCATHGAADSAGSPGIDAGLGPLGPGDGAAPALQVSIEPAAPTVCPGGCVSLSAQAAGAPPPYAITWSGLQGAGSTVQVCPAATTTYTATMTAGAAGRGEVVSQQPTGSASVTVTVSPTCARDGGTTGDAAAAVDLGQAHEICNQSWSVLAADASHTAYGEWGSIARMLALDGAGNLYVAANFSGSVNVAGQILQSAGAESLLVVKVDRACKVLWARAFGAPQAEVWLSSIAAGAGGDVVVTGFLRVAPVDFGSGPVTPGLATPGGTPGSGFIFKLGPSGAGLWSHAYQGSALSPAVVSILDVAIDSRDNAVFAAFQSGGSVFSTALPSVDYGGGAVAFSSALVGLDANGQFVFDADASSAGADGPFEPSSVTTDSAGRIWATGYAGTGSDDRRDVVAYDASGHPQWAQNVSAGYHDCWQPMARVDANGEVFTAGCTPQLDGALIYKFAAGGSPSWKPLAAIPESTTDTSWLGWPGGRLAVDPSGRALLASAFAGSAAFGSVGTLTSGGGIDTAVLRFDAQGRVVGRGRWGGADDDSPVDVAVDAAGDAVIAGWSFPRPGADGGPSASQGSTRYAIFVAKLGW
jgi:hypothetical protein